MAGIHAGAENSFCHSKNFLGAKLDAEFSLATLETVQAYRGGKHSISPALRKQSFDFAFGELSHAKHSWLVSICYTSSRSAILK